MAHVERASGARPPRADKRGRFHPPKSLNKNICCANEQLAAFASAPANPIPDWSVCGN
jgi:hypothetical protein